MTRPVTMKSRCSCRTAKFLVLFIIGLFALAGNTAVAKTLADLSDDDVDSSWNEADAMAHVKDDIREFLVVYDGKRDYLKGVAKEFEKNPLAQAGVRKIAQWGQSLARLLENIPTDQTKYGEEIYERLIETAFWLVSSHREEFSYVEGMVMRGWPMKRREGNKYLVHEGADVVPFFMPHISLSRILESCGWQSHICVV